MVQIRGLKCRLTCEKRFFDPVTLDAVSTERRDTMDSTGAFLGQMEPETQRVPRGLPYYDIITHALIGVTAFVICYLVWKVAVTVGRSRNGSYDQITKEDLNAREFDEDSDDEEVEVFRSP